MPRHPAPEPLPVTFREAHRHRPWALLSRFVEHDLVPPPAAPGVLVELGPGPRAPYCALVAEVTEIGPDGGLRLGLAGEGTSVLGGWDAGAGAAVIEVTSRRGTVSLREPVRLAAPFGLAVTVNANHVTVLVHPAGGDWRPVLTRADPVRALVDLRDPAELGRLCYAHGTAGSRTPGSGTVRLARLRAGYSGQVGVRDPQVVRRADGRPLIRDGRLWLTLTGAGFGHAARARWGVWTLDLADPGRLEEVGALFFARDGLVLGDHAGHLVVDEEAGRTIVVVSSWGDFEPRTGVHLRHLTTGDDVLTGVHVLESERLDVPTSYSTWDPSLARIDGRWHLAFTECVALPPPRFVFHPALAVAGGDYAGGLVRVGADESRRQTEGTILQRLGESWYVLASDRRRRRYAVYDLGMRRVGALRAPYLSNIPHPMVVRAGEGPQAPWWLLTFDGTPWHDDVLGYGTHGDLVVMTGTERARRPGWRRR